MAQTADATDPLEGMEALLDTAAQPARTGNARASSPRVGRLTEGSLASRRLLRPSARAAHRLLDRPRPAGFHHSVSPFQGRNANRRMRTRTSGGVGGAGVSPAPTRSTRGIADPTDGWSDGSTPG